MRYVLVFALVALVALFAASSVPVLFLRLVLVWVALSFGLASAGYAGAGGALFAKGPHGHLPAWSWLVHAPFLLLTALSAAYAHRQQPRPWHEVAPGLWLGRRPSRADGPALRAIGIGGIVDLTAELPAPHASLGHRRYLALPVLDATAPTADQLARGVRWIDEALGHGPVLVHCALGHGRSAALISAWRLAHGAPGLASVESELQSMRPGVRLTPAQRQAVQSWLTRG